MEKNNNNNNNNNNKQLVVVVLISSCPCNRKIAADQSRAITLFKSRRIPYELVDGMKVETKEHRDELFGISGLYGQYPQFFLSVNNDDNVENSASLCNSSSSSSDDDGRNRKLTYIGDWEVIEGINDNSGLPDGILESNPTIITWDKVLSGGIVVFK